MGISSLWATERLLQNANPFSAIRVHGDWISAIRSLFSVICFSRHKQTIKQGIMIRGVFSLYRCYCFPNPLALFQRRFSASNSDEHNKAFVASYLIDKCGLSPKSAQSAAKYVRFNTPERPDAAISFFSDLGFSKSQLSRLVTTVPTLISITDAQKIFMPKIDFFKSKGLSGIELLTTLCACPTILHRSLERHIIPHFDYFKGLLGSDFKVIYALKRHPELFSKKPQSCIEPNIAILQQHGVPQSGIFFLLSQQPGTLFAKPDKFKVVVEEITRLGVDPLKFSFVSAIHVKLSMSKSTWKKKLDAYKSWGLSEEDISPAFVKYPWCMSVSEEKLSTIMDTLVNKLGLDSSIIRKRPDVIGYSLKKRIIPRSSIIQVLLSKGLINKSIVTATDFTSSEKSFLKKFVIKYKDEVPHLSKLYEKQLGHVSSKTVIINCHL